MRAGIGLLSLLIAAAIIFYISFGGKQGGYVGTVMKAGKEGREQASQISGRTGDGVPIEQTIVMSEVNDGSGAFRRLKVDSIVAGTPMDTAFGLQAGDEIEKIGEMSVRDNNDPGLAKAMVCEAYQRNQTLTVMRKDQEMTLTPKTPMSDMHPEFFGKPGAAVNPNSQPALQGQPIPTH